MLKKSNKNQYLSKPGEIIKIISSKIEEGINPQKKERMPKRIEKIKYGKFKNSDLKYLIYGLQFIQAVLDNGIDKITNNILKNENTNIQKSKLAINLREIQINISGFLEAYTKYKDLEYSTEREIESIRNLIEIIQKSRDGVITKKQTRIEKDENGKEIEVESEVSMSEEEIINILVDYIRKLNKIQDTKFSKYIGLGMSIISLMGEIYYNNQNTNEKNQSDNTYIPIAVMTNIGAWLGRRYVSKDYKEKVSKERRKANDLKNEFLKHEPANIEDENNQFEEIKKHMYNAKEGEIDINSKMYVINALETMVMSLIVSRIGIQKLEESKDINSKSLSQIIMEINKEKKVIGQLTSNIKDLYLINQEQEKLKDESEDTVIDILRQIEEKVDPLIEAKRKFKKIEIKDFHGNFYPERYSKTGKKQYRHKIDIPEFSAESGQIILITGKSGRGKSTFFRLLKRGDISNRNSIDIGEKEKVDKLGRQFIALKANDELGIQTNVLQQLVGKEAISKLTDEEVEKLSKILDDVNLSENNILEELASKNYSQFSTGQQKRLVLVKNLYRANNNASVILMDEPVENVEKELAEELLMIISEYTKKSGAIVLLATHNIETAEKYADKRYNIDDDGVMREVEQRDNGIEK